LAQVIAALYGSQLGPVLLRTRGRFNRSVDLRRTGLRDLRDLRFRCGIEDRNRLTFVIARDEFALDKVLVTFPVDLPCYILCGRDELAKR
jgi:hypothetical protein